MIVLGIADGHTATACLLRDGRLLGMVSEERLNRKKSWAGVPKESIRWLLDSNGVNGAQVDLVAVSSLIQPVSDLRAADSSPLRKLFRTMNHVLPDGFMASKLVVNNYVRHYSAKRDFSDLDRVLQERGIAPSKRRVIEHHTAHAATAYFSSPHFSSQKKMLLITMDGSGDGLSATVSIGEDLHLQRLHAIASYHSLGEMYMRVTQFLGMKPLDHEYKVMGLAPYAPQEGALQAYRIFQTFYGLAPDGLSFVNRTGRWGSDLLPLFENQLRGLRFDMIAAGAQKVVEEIVVGFVHNWVEKTGIRSVGCAGGVFMNVKTNMLLSQLPGIKELFFMPSGGDESTGLGAALQAYVQESLAHGKQPLLDPLGTLYLGAEFSEDRILEALQPHAGQLAWKRCSSIEEETAQLLADNKIVGRFAGRMEFGARSLGNRTILANPSDPRNIRKINQAIKMRDFWMPFCPSILHERRHDYTVNPHDWPARYMINAFDSTPLAREELICGLHPSDLTCRPHFVTREDNPGFHQLLKAFEKRTGIGGVLNTSFNLHGEPIVCTPADAVSTFLRSGLDSLLLNDYLVEKKS